MGHQGQAEYLRVPFADFNLLTLPPGEQFKLDFTMLSDIFPTGYHGAAMDGVDFQADRVDLAKRFGATPVKRYNQQLRDLISTGQATPSKIVSHGIGLDQAPGS